MTAWSSLPPEIKKHVVTKLDFMSRHSLRCTSRLDREIVNSTVFKVPRVRFGYKDGICLIMIYTGIDKFLRLELSDCEDGVLIEKFEDSYKTKSPKIVSNTTELFVFGLSILSNLVAHDKIYIKAIEWDIPEEPGTFYNPLDELLIKHLVGSKFHVEEIVTVWNTLNPLMNLFKVFCHYDELKGFRRLGVLPCTGIKPVMISESDFRLDDKPCLDTSFYLDNTVGSKIAMQTGFDLSTASFDVNLPCSASKRELVEEHENYRRRIDDRNAVVLQYASECGKWEYRMFKKHENKLKDGLDAEKCGLSFICKKCADPFEHWYYQTLPRRLVLEPFWIDVLTISRDGVTVTAQFKKQKVLLKEEMNNENHEKAAEASWGFKRVDDSEEEDVTEDEEEEEYEQIGAELNAQNIGIFIDHLVEVKRKCDQQLVEDGFEISEEEISDESDEEESEVESEDNDERSEDVSAVEEESERVESVEEMERSEEVKEEVNHVTTPTQPTIVHNIFTFSVFIIFPILLSFMLYAFYPNIMDLIFKVYN